MWNVLLIVTLFLKLGNDRDLEVNNGHPLLREAEYTVTSKYIRLDALVALAWHQRIGRFLEICCTTVNTTGTEILTKKKQTQQSTALCFDNFGAAMPQMSDIFSESHALYYIVDIIQIENQYL